MDQYALRKSVSQRVFDARHAHAQPGPDASLLDNPLPASAREWLREAAAQFNVKETDIRTFARQGLLKLDALHIVMICQSEAPLPLWLVCGFMPAPPDLHPETWRQALLRASTFAMGLNGICLGIDEQGNAQLTHRIAVDEVGNSTALAELLNDFNSLASSLLDLLIAAAHAADAPSASSHTATPVNEPAAWVAGWQQALAERVDSLADRALDASWHHPLLREARQAMALSPGQMTLNGVLAELRLPERQVSFTADGDGRHMLIMLALALPAPEGKKLQHQLVASQGLFVMSNCTLALDEERLYLCSRWDAFGLDGTALASWLADMMTLAAALELPPEAAHG